MRSSLKLILASLVVVVAFPFAGASAHVCSNPHTHAASGSCKETNGAMHCDPDGPGALPLRLGSVTLFVNPDEEEIEACNDEGAGTTTGRLIVNGDSGEGFVRVSLDSTDQQPEQVAGGYIIVQAGGGAEQTGVWCSPTGGAGDGYSQPRNDPGDEGGNLTQPDQWVECAPGN
jgi:hypothetical protein